VDVTLPRDPETLRLDRVRAIRAGQTLRDVEYTYDPVGQIATMRDTIPGNIEFHQFSYDGLYRLAGYQTRSNNANGNVLRSGAYSYDLGNLQQFGDTSPHTLTYGDATHPSRLTDVTGQGGGAPIGYNGLGHTAARGNMTAIGYDAFLVRRAEGPIFQITYVAWAVVRLLRRDVLLVRRHEQGLGQPGRNGSLLRQPIRVLGLQERQQLAALRRTSRPAAGASPDLSRGGQR
jgi:hypothetical protein